MRRKKQDKTTIIKLKRPRYIGTKWWEYLKSKGYLKTLKKIGEGGKVTLTVQDVRNLEKMQQIHRNPRSEIQRRENKIMKEIHDYYVALREAYITEKKSVSEIVRDIKRAQDLDMLDKAYQNAITRDIKRVGWNIRPRYETDFVKDAIEILNREKINVTPEVIKNFSAAYYRQYPEFKVPTRRSFYVIRKKLLQKLEEGEFKK